jgi:integrase
MASVNFLYRSAKEKSNLVLRLLYRHEGKDYVFGAKTQFEVEKTYWIKQHKKRSKDIEITNKQTEVNNELNRLENHVLNVFNSLSIESINKEWLQAQIEYYYNPPKQAKNIPTNLVDYITYYIEYRKHEIKNSSQKKFNVIKNKLKRFEKYRKKQIFINEVNDSFKNEFVSYCKKELYSQNTIQRELAIIKTFCKHARFLGLETHPQLDSLRLDKAKVEKIYLSFEDLTKIENIAKEELTDSLDNAKDWLIISCYIGQRISDFMHFTDKQIRIEEGKHLLEFTQKKTNKLTTIPLHPKVLEILSKRNGRFPYPISDQKYNDYIKKVCELAKLNDLIIGSKKVETEINSKVYRKKTGTYKKYDLVTSHIGRRSFATNFYGQIPTTFLINMTNHSSEAMFLNYIGKSNKDLAKETFKFF